MYESGLINTYGTTQTRAVLFPDALFGVIDREPKHRDVSPPRRLGFLSLRTQPLRAELRCSAPLVPGL